MSADSLAEIEARLDELDDKEKQASELTVSFIDASDALDAICTHPLVDDETVAKVRLLKHLLRKSVRTMFAFTKVFTTSAMRSDGSGGS